MPLSLQTGWEGQGCFSPQGTKAQETVSFYAVKGGCRLVSIIIWVVCMAGPGGSGSELTV